MALARQEHAGSVRSQVARNCKPLYMQQFGQLSFSELTYYEVTRGLKAIGAVTQLADFERFCQQHRILPFTHAAAVHAADIWADLKQRGQLIGEIDVLIAGVALSEGLAVVSHNMRHFGCIAGLTVIDWTQ
jgi:tRNA(fMet)-specific endonuclease VapC